MPSQVSMPLIGAQVVFNSGQASESIMKLGQQSDYLFYSLKRIATYSAIFGFFYALKNVVEEVWQTELHLAEVQTLLEQGNERAAESFEEVKRQLLSLDPFLGRSTELVSGLYEIMSAGVQDPVEALKLLVVSAKYAKVGLTDLKTSAATLTSVMRAYNFSADEMRKQADILFTSVAEGKFHVQDLNSALGNVLPTASAMGVSVEEVSAALAMLSNRGLSASESATALNRLLLSILRPLDKSKEWFNKLGIEWGLNALQGQGLVGVLEKLTSASQRYSNVLPEVFRRETGLRAAFVLTGDMDTYRELLDRMGKSYQGAGVLAEHFGTINRTVAMEIKALQASVAQGANQFMSFSGVVATLVRGLSILVSTAAQAHVYFLGYAGIISVLAHKKKLLVGSIEQLNSSIQLNRIQNAQNVVVMQTEEAQINKNILAAKAKMATLAKWNLILIAAGVVYATLKYAIDQWTASTERGMAAQAEYSRQLAEVIKKQKILRGMNPDIYKTVVEEYDRAAMVIDRTWQKIADRFYASGLDMQQTIKAITKDLQEAGVKTTEWLGLSGRWMEGGAADNKRINLVEDLLIAREQGRELTEKERDLLMEISRIYGVNIELTQEMNDKVNSLTGAWDRLGDRARFVSRDLQKVLSEFQDDPYELAANHTLEELKSMLKSVKFILENSTEAEGVKEVLKSMFNINFAEEDIAKLKISIERLQSAIDQEPDVKYGLLRQEYLNSLLANMKNYTMTNNEARASAEALYMTWVQMEKQKMSMDQFAGLSEIKEKVKLLAFHLHFLDQKSRDFIQTLIDLGNKGPTELEKLQAKFKTINEKIIDDRLRIASEIEKFENALDDQKYNNTLATAEKNAALWRQTAVERYMLAVQSHQDLVAAHKEYVEDIARLERYKSLAMLVAAKEGYEQGLKEMTKFLTELEKKVQGAFPATVEKLKQQILGLSTIFPALADALKLMFQGLTEAYDAMSVGKGTLVETYTALDSVGDALGIVSTGLRDIKTSLGDTSIGLTLFIDIMDAMAKGMSGLVNSLRALEKAEEITDSFTKTLSNIGSVIGIVMAVTGAILSIAAGLNKAAHDKAIQQVKEDFKELGDISDTTAEKILAMTNSLAEQIQRITKQKTGVTLGSLPTDAIAEIKLLSDIMKDTGINVDNITGYWGQLTEAIKLYQAGLLSLKEVQDIVEGSFGQLLQAAQKLGQTGSKEMVEFIRKAREAGLYLKEVHDYVMDRFGIQATKAASALDGLMSMVNSGKFTFEEMAASVMNIYNAMILNGVSFIEVVSALGPVLDAIIEKYKEQGDTSNEAFNALLKFRELVTVNQDLLNAISGNVAVLAALNDTASLTEEAFNAASLKASEFYNQLIEAGFSSDQAMLMMLPTLELLASLQEQYGWKVDENTQKLIDQAKEMGLFGSETVEIVDVLLAGFGLIILALGRDIPEAMQDAIDALYGLSEETTEASDAMEEELIEPWLNMEEVALECINNVFDTLERRRIESGQDVTAVDETGTTATTQSYPYQGITPFSSEASKESIEIKDILKEIAEGVSTPPEITLEPMLFQKDDHYEIVLIQKAINARHIIVPASSVEGG